MRRSLTYGSEEIVYTLNFRERKTLGITVHPDRSTEVNAPVGSSIEKIENSNQCFFINFNNIFNPLFYLFSCYFHESHIYYNKLIKY